MRLAVAWALAVIVGLIAGDIIGVILGAGQYRGAIPGAVVAVSVFMWRRREEGSSLKAIKVANWAPSEAPPRVDGLTAPLEGMNAAVALAPSQRRNLRK